MLRDASLPPVTARRSSAPVEVAPPAVEAAPPEVAPPEVATPAPADWTRVAVGVGVATLFLFLAVGAVLPVLPGYVRGPLGASDVAVGIVVGGYAITALLTRPLAGRLADRRGRRLVFTGGAVIMGLAGALYALPLGVAGLVVARLVLGVGEGLAVTAGNAWVIDVAPPERRAQIIGFFGLGIWGGLAAGPVLGEALRAVGGYGAVWALTALLPLASAAVAVRLADRYVPQPARGPRPLLPRPVVLPGMAIGLASVGYAAMAGFVVLHLADAGVGSGALVLVAFSASVVAVRLVAGRVPDSFGARSSALLAGSAEAVGLALLASAGSLPVALAGALVMGAGFSLLYPALALLVLDGVDSGSRAGALGAFSAFFDLGVGLGAPLVGAVAATAGYAAAFWVAAGLAAAGSLVVLRASSARAVSAVRGREAPVHGD